MRLKVSRETELGLPWSDARHATIAIMAIDNSTTK